MKITWLGHGSFRIEIAGEVLLIDPWLTGNPSFPDDRREEALKGATRIFVTHGHFDHTSELEEIAKETGAPVYTIVELASYFGNKGVETVGFNKGGTVEVGDVKVTMVQATHSSSMDTENGPIYTGTESGFVIRGEGHSIYVSGDTDVMADMGVIAARFSPDIGILCAGGHFTMDMEGAAFAAKTFFDFKTVFPCHYKTFDALEQSAEKLKAELPGVDVKDPEVMETVEI